MEIIEYQTYREKEILPLYASVGWTAYTDAPDVLHRGFERSLLTFAAYEGETLVGLARAVGDGETVVLMQDLLVFPQYQRRGIGAALMRAMMERFANVRQFQLLTDDTEKTLAFTARSVCTTFRRSAVRALCADSAHHRQDNS